MANITVEYDGPIATITVQSPGGDRMVGRFNTEQEDDVEVEVLENTTGYSEDEAALMLDEAYMRFVDGADTEGINWAELETF